jgi:ribosomal-protein-alanine N-acetyltransferase
MLKEYEDKYLNNINVLGRYLDMNYLFKLTNERRCFFYEEDEEVLGFITFDILSDRSEIIDMIVHINHRKQGIGLELINKAISISKEQGCKSITLEVKCTNKPAIEFYKKNGFKIVSTRKRYYENGSIDAHLMYREL